MPLILWMLVLMVLPWMLRGRLSARPAPREDTPPAAPTGQVIQAEEWRVE